MRFIFLFLTTLSASLAADYFPLAVGNQWIYRQQSGFGKGTRLAEVTGTTTVNGREYFLYRDLAGIENRIRYNDAGQLVALLTDGTEGLWADFAAEEGSTYPSQIDSCAANAKIESKETKLELGRRTLTGGLTVVYSPTQCADAGLARDVFFPGLGLVEREAISFAGPQVFRLIYARVDGATLIHADEVGFRIALGAATVPSDFELNLRLTIENTTETPLTLHFTSGQSFDIGIRDERGNRVYTWSANKLFPAVIRDEVITGEKNWLATERLHLEPGTYIVEAWLTTGAGELYKASLPLTVIP